MIGNLPNLVRNTCDGLTEGGQKLYLDMLDRHQGWSDREGERRAFTAADRYDRNFGTVLSHILRRGPVFEQGPHIEKLERFFADRWKNNFMGDG